MRTPALIALALMAAISWRPVRCEDTQPSTAELIQRLSTDDFEKRDEAQRSLIARAGEAWDELRAAAVKSPDPEVRNRALQALTAAVKPIMKSVFARFEVRSKAHRRYVSKEMEELNIKDRVLEYKLSKEKDDVLRKNLQIEKKDVEEASRKVNLDHGEIWFINISHKASRSEESGDYSFVKDLPIEYVAEIVPIDRKLKFLVTTTLHEESLDAILKELTALTTVTLTLREKIPEGAKFTVHCKDKPLEDVLKDLCNEAKLKFSLDKEGKKIDLLAQ